MLDVGEPVPPFAAQTTEGKLISDEVLRGRPYVVFFFPRAFTPGCVKETKAFRDAYPRLRGLGFEVIGISTDPHDRQCVFSEWLGAAYPLIGDVDRKIARAFGVMWPLLPWTRRATFIVDEGGIIRASWHYELAVDRHVIEVERFVNDLRRRTA
jgi:thioredoxin-dependent peroxiredoxin